MNVKKKISPQSSLDLLFRWANDIFGNKASEKKYATNYNWTFLKSFQSYRQMFRKISVQQVELMAGKSINGIFKLTRFTLFIAHRAAREYCAS